MNKRVRMKMLLASASYTGNRLKAISDGASPNVYDGAFEFVNKVNQTTEYSYYSSGDLKSDRNKGIALVSYDLLGHPTRIQMTSSGELHCICKDIYPRADHLPGFWVDLPLG